MTAVNKKTRKLNNFSTFITVLSVVFALLVVLVIGLSIQRALEIRAIESQFVKHTENYYTSKDYDLIVDKTKVKIVFYNQKPQDSLVEIIKKYLGVNDFELIDNSYSQKNWLNSSTGSDLPIDTFPLEIYKDDDKLE